VENHKEDIKNKGILAKCQDFPSRQTKAWGLRNFISFAGWRLEGRGEEILANLGQVGQGPSWRQSWRLREA
jgi:hypothetical protein